MRIVCATPDWLGKYKDIWDQHRLGYDFWPSRLTVFVAEGSELVAGVLAYDTSGPFLVFEHLVTNETASLRQRYQAADILVGECVRMCRLMGKFPMVQVRHKGIKRILEKHGLVAPGAFFMTCNFSNLETHDYEIPWTSPKHSRRIKDSAPTERAPAGDPEDDLGVYAQVSGGAG
jgi:hypothetical protein